MHISTVLIGAMKYSSAYMQTKSFCEDLTEGKFSYPIIHAIRSKPQDSRLLNILRQRTEDLDVKRYAVQWMISCGSLDHTRQVDRFFILRVVLNYFFVKGIERSSC